MYGLVLKEMRETYKLAINLSMETQSFLIHIYKHFVISNDHDIIVTGFAKTRHNAARTEIHFIA